MIWQLPLIWWAKNLWKRFLVRLIKLRGTIGSLKHRVLSILGSSLSHLYEKRFISIQALKCYMWMKLRHKSLWFDCKDSSSRWERRLWKRNNKRKLRSKQYLGFFNLSPKEWTRLKSRWGILRISCQMKCSLKRQNMQ